MPGLDGTGPLGRGSMTGGAWGFCAMRAEKLPIRRYGFSGRRGFGRSRFGVEAPFPDTAYTEDAIGSEQRFSSIEDNISSIKDQVEEIGNSVKKLKKES